MAKRLAVLIFIVSILALLKEDKRGGNKEEAPLLNESSVITKNHDDTELSSKTLEDTIGNIMEDFDSDMTCADVILELEETFKPLFRDGIGQFKEEIKSARDDAIKSQVYRFKQNNYTYEIWTGKLTHIILDIKNKLGYLFVEWAMDPPYPNAFYKFLHYSTSYLVNSSPEKFVNAFGNFFDRFLRRKIKKKPVSLKNILQRRSDKREQRKQMLYETILSEISTKKSIRKFYEDKKEEKPDWSNFADQIHEFMNSRFIAVFKLLNSICSVDSRIEYNPM